MRRIKTPKVKLPKLKAPRLNASRVKMPKLSPPKLRAPRIKGPKLRAPRPKVPGIKAPSIKTPPFLGNLYRDMRDRRLLLPALALAVALIVVPVALSSSPDTAPAPAPAADTAGSEPEAATSPAVLAEQLGITDYRKRLEEFKSKNPFRSKFASPPPTESSAAAADAASSGATSADTTTTAGTPTSPSSTTSPASSPSTAPSQPPEPSEPTLFAFRVDIAIGPPGDVTRRKHVEQGKFLPGDGKPMVAFAGATEDLKHALFLITDDVSSVTGDGRCVPGRNDCMLLRLAIGDEAKLAYAPEGDRTYKLKLIGIGLEPVDAKGADGQAKQASMSAVAAQGLAAEG